VAPERVAEQLRAVDAQPVGPALGEGGVRLQVMPTSPLQAVLDHIAVAVPDPDAAEQRWRDELGGRYVGYGDSGVFFSRQLRFAGGGKLELLAPSAADASEKNFVRRFLDRFGAGVHHVTLKVPDLPEALRTLDGGGLEPVDVQDTNEYWQEAFLRPSQVGGLVVQIAWSFGSEADWAARSGFTPEEPDPSSARFVGLALRHPDLDAACRLWALLGADLRDEGDEVVCSWPDSPLGVFVRRGAAPGPDGLRFADVSLPADAVCGAAVSSA
jgi:catechol 2,3-dioxygenase-like lactoylglutathione lyase family enzyme